jgi:GTP cyclohydrolase III
MFNENVIGMFQMVVVTDMVVEEIVEMIADEVEVTMTVGIGR